MVATKLPRWPADGLRTERLVLRRPHPYDGEALWERRNHPDVARYQDWQTPYALERADELIGEMTQHDGPLPFGWWMIIVTLADSGQPGEDTVIGDLAVNGKFDGRSFEIGYTLARDHWGQGYATEAAGALVRWLFEHTNATRIGGQLHPDNPASARVLERVGMTFEGHTRLSYWVGDDNSDDWIYGVTREAWAEWNARPTGPPDEVRLVEITHENSGQVEKLETHRSQRRFVATVLESFSDALFPRPQDGHPVTPWLRAVEADGVVAGFVMVAEPNEHVPDAYVWRLLIDRRHQRRGIGTRVLELVAEQARGWGASELSISYRDEPGGPKPVYERFGFVPTGRVEDGEHAARLRL